MLGAIARTRTSTGRGVAVTSSIHPDDITHIEPVRYGKGSNAMSLLQTVLTDGGAKPAVADWLRELGVQRKNILRLYDLKHWSERTLVALVAMQTADNSIRPSASDAVPAAGGSPPETGSRRPEPGLDPGREPGGPADGDQRMNGTPGGAIGGPFNVPMTAHFIGGCAIGDSPETGVVDAYHRLYGYDGLHVVDGSTISARPGVQPVTDDRRPGRTSDGVLANKGQADRRPGLGSAYEPVSPVQPLHAELSRRPLRPPSGCPSPTSPPAPQGSPVPPSRLARSV